MLYFLLLYLFVGVAEGSLVILGVDPVILNELDKGSVFLKYSLLLCFVNDLLGLVQA